MDVKATCYGYLYNSMGSKYQKLHCWVGDELTLGRTYWGGLDDVDKPNLLRPNTIFFDLFDGDSTQIIKTGVDPEDMRYDMVQLDASEKTWDIEKVDSKEEEGEKEKDDVTCQKLYTYDPNPNFPLPLADPFFFHDGYDATPSLNCENFGFGSVGKYLRSYEENDYGEQLHSYCYGNFDCGDEYFYRRAALLVHLPAIELRELWLRRRLVLLIAHRRDNMIGEILRTHEYSAFRLLVSYF